MCAATCILFGDGCGAVLLSGHDGACSLLGSSLHSDGNGRKHLKARAPLRRPGPCSLCLRQSSALGCKVMPLSASGLDGQGVAKQR